MGVWDMVHLLQQYRKMLVRADNPAFSEKTRNAFRVKAENTRQQMIRYMENVEKQSELMKLESKI
jgi:hypothetical protein